MQGFPPPQSIQGPASPAADCQAALLAKARALLLRKQLVPGRPVADLPCLAVYPRVPGLGQDTNENRTPRHSPAAAAKPVQRPDVRHERRHPRHATKLRPSRSAATLERAHAHAAHCTDGPRGTVRPRRPFATPAPAVQRGRPGSVCAARRLCRSWSPSGRRPRFLRHVRRWRLEGDTARIVC